MPEAKGDASEITIVANDIRAVGGMERQLTELITGLLDAGARVTVISWTCTLSEHPNLRWIRVPGPGRPFAVGYPCFLLVASLLVWLRGRGVIHSTGAIVLNRVSVCTVHFCHQALEELPEFSRASRAGLLHRLNASVCKWMSRMLERWCYRPGRCEQLVGVSKGVARELARHFPATEGRIAVIPNGVDTDVFHPSERTDAPSNRDGLRALFVGSEWERKGLRVVIEALEENPGVSLTVVGDGDAEAYSALADERSLTGRVIFRGSTAEVAECYRQADVFVMPTVYETFSLVTYEAAASGLPLLVTRVNGVEDLLADGSNGWFIERDPTDVRRRLEQLHSDPKRREEMSHAARKASLDYSWAQVVERYLELYGRVGS